MTKRSMLMVVLGLFLSAAAVLAQDATPEVTPAEGQTGAAGQEVQIASTVLTNVDGSEAGAVWFYSNEGSVVVEAFVQNVTPGFHGFHVHAVGSCEDTSEGPFMAAGGHLNLSGAAHPQHEGDLPTLLVMQNSTGYLVTQTDRFTLQDLLDADGSALIIHENPDNFANIPERYGEPDAETLEGGDSGMRIACGVIQSGDAVRANALDDTGGTGDSEESAPDATPAG